MIRKSANKYQPKDLKLMVRLASGIFNVIKLLNQAFSLKVTGTTETMLTSGFEPTRHLELLGLRCLSHGDELEIPSPVPLSVAYGNQRSDINLSLPALGFCCVDNQWLSCQFIEVLSTQQMHRYQI